MQIEKMTALYQKNTLPSSKLKEALDYLVEVEDELKLRYQSASLDDIDVKLLDELIAHFLKCGRTTIDNFIILMRYFKVIGRNDLFIHLTKYTGILGVVESMLAKLNKVVGQKRADEIKNLVSIPVLGTPPEQMPSYTKELLAIFEKHLNPRELKAVLADNHHQIPREAFIGEKIHYEEAASFDDYLQGLHQRKIAELRNYQKENRVWFEQEINDEVIDFVSGNQEVLSAVRKGDDLFITKIPYDTKAYLAAKSPAEKRYHACHCPFVKSAMQSDSHNISPAWCLCSGGFTKFPFDVLFERDLPVTCLETPLKGDQLCRFVISLAGVAYKK